MEKIIGWPQLITLISPGYWVASLCKKACDAHQDSKQKRSGLIKGQNAGNILISLILLLLVIFIRHEGYLPHYLLSVVVLWRYVSRCFEIAIAFAKDITTSESKSSLGNHERMKLAIISYLEIYIFSAAFYACYGKKEWLIDTQSITDSLYVGTLTNVAEVARNLSVPEYFVFIQIMAIFSLVLLSIAGYLGSVKS